jgi:hypothetical protein
MILQSASKRRVTTGSGLRRFTASHEKTLASQALARGGASEAKLLK